MPTADDERRVLDQVAGNAARGGTHRRDERGTTTVADATEHDDLDTWLLAHGNGEVTKIGW